jgi:hypothetical protein
MLNMRVPSPGEAPAPILGVTAGPITSSTADHHTVIVTSTADAASLRTDATADATPP